MTILEKLYKIKKIFNKAVRENKDIKSLSKEENVELYTLKKGEK